MRALQFRARLARLWRGFVADWPVLEAQMPQIAPPFMGLPGLTVSTGRTATHPMGIQAIADRGYEHILLDMADFLARISLPCSSSPLCATTQGPA